MILATYVSSTSFTIDAPGDWTPSFKNRRRLTLNQSTSGINEVTVESSSYSSGSNQTTVVIDTEDVTADLVSILLGPSTPESVGEHLHTGKGEGGLITALRNAAQGISPLEGSLLVWINGQWTYRSPGAEGAYLIMAGGYPTWTEYGSTTS